MTFETNVLRFGQCVLRGLLIRLKSVNFDIISFFYFNDYCINQICEVSASNVWNFCTLLI